jgi:hypothetical protein
MTSANWIAQFSPVALMVSIIAINHLISNQRADRKIALEAARLRVALVAELNSLFDLYKMNLQLIDQKANYIISTRPSLVVYKGTIARMAMLLDDSLIEQVIKVFSQNERFEAIVAARSNLKCGLTYQFSLAEANFDEWKKILEQAAANVECVSALLGRHNQASQTFFDRSEALWEACQRAGPRPQDLRSPTFTSLID